MTRVLLGVSILALTWTGIGCVRESPPGEVKNIVLISIDALGAKHVGAYGYERETTPELDRLARRGVLFERAYTQQNWTLTSHLTMMTGVYPRVHGADGNHPANPAATTLAQHLSRNGYATGAFVGKLAYMNADYGLGRGFDVYRARRENAEGRTADAVAWLTELARRRRENPGLRFFVFVHYYDVHSDARTDLPYAAPEPYGMYFLPDGLDWERRGDTKLLMQMQVAGDVSEKDREVLSALYDGGVLYTDQVGLAPLLRALTELGLDEDTLVIVTADHGEEFFEHGAFTHQLPYDEVARVPLVIQGPGLSPGTRVPDVVELVDLMPTVLSLVGLPIPDHVQGRDLSPLLRGESLPGRAAHVDGILGKKPWARFPSGLILEIDGQLWSYLNTVYERSEAGTSPFETRSAGELYLLDRDPDQKENVVERHPELAKRLEAELLEWYAENRDRQQVLGTARASQQMLSDEERERLRGLGYVE